MSCSTTCSLTKAGCSGHGTTVIITTAASACDLIQHFCNIPSGDVPDISSPSGIPSPTTGPPITAPVSSTTTPQLALHYARRTVLRGILQHLGEIVRTAHYPTLPPTSGMSTANCAYTSAPSATVNPISVTAAPANFPGEAGLPGCNCVIYPDEQGCPYANYCDCGGMYAGSLGH